MKSISLITITFVFLACASLILFFSPKPDKTNIIENTDVLPAGCKTFTGRVATGDNLAKILEDCGICQPCILEAQRSFQLMHDLRRLHPGDQYEVAITSSGILHRLVYKPDKTTSYIVRRGEEGCYNCLMRKEPTKWVEQTITGQVDENIYKDLLDQGYNENFVANLVAELGDEIFAWRIDFFSEQRVGDRFSVLLEREYILNEKEPLNNIRVVAALYEGTGTRNKKNYAFKFTPSGSQPAEFFDDKGKAARGLFLRAPFSHKSFRISSHFSRSRFHPIHRVWRPHHGTDYAAPVGTPVVAIGSGKIVRAGWHGGYGRCIDIRHNKKYMSRYGHMSKINVHVGENVAQGQYIGKSGATGVATGPHLHFEMHVYGKQRNFLRLKFPSTKAVAKKDLRRFETVVGQYIGKLNSAINMTNENLLMVAAHKTDEAD